MCCLPSELVEFDEEYRQKKRDLTNDSRRNSRVLSVEYFSGAWRHSDQSIESRRGSQVELSQASRMGMEGRNSIVEEEELPD